MSLLSFIERVARKSPIRSYDFGLFRNFQEGLLIKYTQGRYKSLFFQTSETSVLEDNETSALPGNAEFITSYSIVDDTIFSCYNEANELGHALCGKGRLAVKCITRFYKEIVQIILCKNIVFKCCFKVCFMVA